VPNGAIHVLPVGASGRYQSGDVTPALQPTLLAKGVAKEISGYPRYLTGGQRVFGSIVATNDELFFGATAGTVTDIDKRGDPNALQGATYGISLNAAASGSSTLSTANQISSGHGGIGGTVAVSTNTAGQVTVVTVTAGQIVTTVVTGINNTAAEHSINNLGLTPTGLLGWIMRRSGHDY